ncbi:hypothetical protein [Primorskyibacter sp. S87]|uniref:hypothetical protein n=1 Tax=Primorskyibacter sp. S87 TaxID=3415126 RepID=UPI003C79948E
MSQIEDLQSRITAAMERISTGLDVLSEQSANMLTDDSGGAAEGDAENFSEVAAALEEEKLANAQLEERLKSLKARHAEELAALQDTHGEADSAELEAEIAGLKAQLEQKAEAESARDAAEAEIAELKAQLEDRSQIEAFEAEIETLKAQDQSAEVERLQSENSALNEQLAAVEDPQPLKAELEMLRAERVTQAEVTGKLDMDIQRLRQSNDQLREAITALREANEAGVGEPHLINKAMLSELDALRAVRATDAAEAAAILARLEPLLAQANLPEGEEA